MIYYTKCGRKFLKSVHVGTTGYFLQEVLSLKNNTFIICNRDGKKNGAEPVRVINLADIKENSSKEPYDIIFGTFLICKIGTYDDEPELADMGEDELHFYEERFKNQEFFDITYLSKLIHW